MSIKNIIIKKNTSIKLALNKLNKSKAKGLIVVEDDKKLIGTLASGDLRQAILKKKNLKKTIKEIFNTNPIYVFDNASLVEIHKILIKEKITFIPIVNEKRKVLDVVFLSQFKKKKLKKIKNKKINCPVVIMAGGKGERLAPFTKVLPKPLIPVENKTIIEHIINSYKKNGVKKFYITLNYKNKIIKAFFNDLNENKKIKFIDENIPLGTAGGLYYLKKEIKENFILSNCDTILKTDHFEFLKVHKKNKNDITIIVSSQIHKVPYGTCKIDKKNNLIELVEKPKIKFLVNTGIYCISTSIFKIFKKKNYLDMDDLIILAMKKNFRVGVFSISSKSWLDIGQWVEYRNTTSKINNLI